MQRGASFGWAREGVETEKSLTAQARDSQAWVFSVCASPDVTRSHIVITISYYNRTASLCHWFLRLIFGLLLLVVALGAGSFLGVC